MGMVGSSGDYSDDDKDSLWQTVKKAFKSKQSDNAVRPQRPPARSPPDTAKYRIGSKVRSSDWTLCTVDGARKTQTGWEYQLTRADASKSAFDGHKWQKEATVCTQPEDEN